jgi:two-component system, NtrC family, sensor kinase
MKMPYPATKNVRKNGGRVVGNARERRLRYPSMENNDLPHLMAENSRDVTERKNTERALQESHIFASSLLENAPHATVVINPDTSVRYVNPAWERLNGWTLADVVGLKAPYPWWPKHLTEEFLPRFMEAIRQPVGKGEIMALKKNGEAYWIDMNWVSVTHDGESQYVIINSVDVTERKIAEEKRQAILKTALDGFWICDLEGKFLEVNDSYRTMTGYTREELLKMSIKDVEAIEKPEQTSQRIKKIVEQGGDRFETQHKCKDGRIIDIEISVKYTDNGQGQLVVFVRDITERKEVEAKLQAQKQLIESILATMPEGVLVVDASDRVILANESARRIFHRGKNVIINKLLKDIIPVEPLLNLYHSVKLDKNEDNRLEFSYRVNNIDKIVACGAVKMDEERTLLTFTDVSREREEKEKLYLTDRLASIGEMAVGLAHELNNPLTGILSLSQLLIESDIPPESKEDLQCINSEARRAANIVKNVLLFTRNNNYENGQASANEVVRDVLRLREYEEKTNNISVVTNLQEDLPDILIDRFQLQQVFLNIIINAEAAIKEAGRPGRLTVTTEKVNHHVNIMFGDNGCGIKKNVLPRIFDPFFTTKEIGKGTGLGLSICFGIVSQHRGKISVRTQVNKGTTFTVRMPAAP